MQWLIPSLLCLFLLVPAAAGAQAERAQCPRGSEPTTIEFDRFVTVHNGHGGTSQEPLVQHLDDEGQAASLNSLRSFLQERHMSCGHAVRISVTLSSDRHTYQAYVIVRRPDDACWERASSIIVIQSGHGLATPVGESPQAIVEALRINGFVMALNRHATCPGHPLF